MGKLNELIGSRWNHCETGWKFQRFQSAAMRDAEWIEPKLVERLLGFCRALLGAIVNLMEG